MLDVGVMVLGNVVLWFWGGAGRDRGLVGWFFGSGGLCWGMRGYVWGFGCCFGLGQDGFGLVRGGFGLVWGGFGGMILGVCAWDRVGQGGFAGCSVGVLGLVGCGGSWWGAFEGWGDVLDLDGLVLGSSGVVLGLGMMVMGHVVLGFGVGQVWSAGW